MDDTGDSAWGRGGDDDEDFEDELSSESEGEDEPNDLDYSTLASSTPAAKSQSDALHSALDRLSHEYHLKELEQSQRDDTAIVKTNPFTKAKKLAVQRARKASLPPDSLHIPPSTAAPPRRKGNLTCAVADPDRKEPTPPPPQKRAPSPYRRKAKGWADARGIAIPSTFTPATKTRKKGAKAKASTKAKDDNGDGAPKKKGKAGGARGRKKNEDSAITFGLLPAHLSTDSPLVRGFEKQRSLPLRSTKAKPAPFPMAQVTGPSRAIKVDRLIAGTADEARKELEDKQARKATISSIQHEGQLASDNVDLVPLHAEDYDDPPTMTHASANSSIVNLSLGSSSQLPYSSPLGRRQESIRIHQPQPRLAQAELTTAQRLEQVLKSTADTRSFRPTVTVYSNSEAPPLPSQEEGWTTLSPTKGSGWGLQSGYDQQKWPKNVARPLPPFERARIPINPKVFSPIEDRQMSHTNTKVLFIPSNKTDQQSPMYTYSTSRGSSTLRPSQTTSKYFSVDEPGFNTASLIPGWAGPRTHRTGPEDDVAIDQMPFGRKVKHDQSFNTRSGSIMSVNQRISNHAGSHIQNTNSIHQDYEDTSVHQAPDLMDHQHQDSNVMQQRSQQRITIGRKRQVEEDEDSDEGWGKAYPRSYRSPTHESTFYEAGPSSQQTPRKIASTMDILARFAHTPAKTPRVTEHQSGQAFSRFY